MVNGKAGFAAFKRLKIWYESISPKFIKRTILLIMELQMTLWAGPKKFIKSFVDQLSVILYDHRVLKSTGGELG